MKEFDAKMLCKLTQCRFYNLCILTSFSLLMVNKENAYCLSFISAFLGQILFILACNYDIHASLDEFEIWSDPTTDHRVSFP